MASRVRIPFAIETQVEVSKTGGGNVKVVEPVSGATISGVNRVSASAAKFYSSETSETPVGSPVTDSNGNVPYWIEEGAWSITIEGGTPSIAPVTYAFDALSGRGTVKLATGAVTSSTIANEAVGTAQIAKASVNASKVIGGSLTSESLLAGTLKTLNYENGSVTFSKMSGPYGTSLANGTALVAGLGSTVVLNPISFTAHGGHCFAIWNATGYVKATGNFAFALDLDNIYTGSQSLLYMNLTEVHTAFPTAITPLGILSAGSHTLRIRSSSLLITDPEFDHAFLAVLELP